MRWCDVTKAGQQSEKDRDSVCVASVVDKYSKRGMRGLGRSYGDK